MISVVIPVFNEEDNITPLYEELEEVIPKLSEEYEIIFVDDGSTDNTLSNLLKLIEVHNHLRVIQFKRNFGKSAALTAGFNQVKGEIVVTLDGDGQDNPTNIPLLFEELSQDVDVVCGWRYKRKDSLIKKLNSGIYNLLNRIFTKSAVHDNNCMLRVYRKEVISNLILLKGAHRYLPSIIGRSGFKVIEKKVSHRSRLSGKSKYNTKRLFKGFLDLFRYNLTLKNKDEGTSRRIMYEIEERYGFD